MENNIAHEFTHLWNKAESSDRGVSPEIHRTLTFMMALEAYAEANGLVSRPERPNQTIDYQSPELQSFKSKWFSKWHSAKTADDLSGVFSTLVSAFDSPRDIHSNSPCSCSARILRSESFASEAFN